MICKASGPISNPKQSRVKSDFFNITIPKDNIYDSNKQYRDGLPWAPLPKMSLGMFKNMHHDGILNPFIESI